MKQVITLDPHSCSFFYFEQVFINFAKNQTDILDDTSDSPENMGRSVQNSGLGLFVFLKKVKSLLT